MNYMKYVIIETDFWGFPVPFVFPELIDHSDFLEFLKKRYSSAVVVSAGKVHCGHFEKGFVSATPGSVTLGIQWSKERQEEDTKILRYNLGDDAT